MNILTFDIEEWYIEKIYYGARTERYAEYDSLLATVLDALDKNHTKATFFCLGEMANDFPKIIKEINERGHEIGCHSNKHYWLTKLSKDEIIEDTQIAIDSLQQCIGKKVLSYRAPAFSIGESNSWVFEVLADCGIQRDASVFPANRDFGGFASFGQDIPTVIQMNNSTLKEFPVSTLSIFGNSIAYSGGGYFRFFPLSFIKEKIKKQPYTMTYFHLGDIMPIIGKIMTRNDYEQYFKENGSFYNRYKRYIKSNFGAKGALEKLIKLIETQNYICLAEADNDINWDLAPKFRV